MLDDGVLVGSKTLTHSRTPKCFSYLVKPYFELGILEQFLGTIVLANVGGETFAMLVPKHRRQGCQPGVHLGQHGIFEVVSQHHESLSFSNRPSCSESSVPTPTLISDTRVSMLPILFIATADASVRASSCWCAIIEASLLSVSLGSS